MIRLASWNVSRARDLGAAAAVIAELAPDVLCLVDAPRRGRLRRLARRTGLEVAARAGGRRVAAAVLVAPTVRVLSSTALELPAADSTLAPRAVAQAILGVGGLRLSAAACQLGLQPVERADHATRLLDFLAPFDAAVVLGIDVNESARGEVFQRLAAAYPDAWVGAGSGDGDTYPTPDPSTRRDALFLSPTLDVRAARVLREAPVDVASAHRPLLVEVAGADDEPTTEPA